MTDNWLARICESASREVRSWPTPLQLVTPSARWEWSKRIARLKEEYPRGLYTLQTATP